MKFLNYIIKNIRRNKKRTGFTITGTTVAIFIFCSILSIETGLKTLARVSASKFLIIVSDKSRSIPVMGKIPVSYSKHIKQIPNVIDVTPEQFYMTSYRKEGEQVVIIGVDPEKYEKFRDFEISAGSYSLFKKEKKAAIVGKQLAKKYNWQVGKEIVLKDNSFSFIVRGILGKPLSRLEEAVFVNIEYLQETINRQGQATRLLAKVNNPTLIEKISSQIDTIFANYPSRTKSQSESKDWEVFLKDIAPMIGFMILIGLIGIIVAIIESINSISISLQERVKEIGILKALGYKNKHLLIIVLTESIILSFTGGILGTLLAYLSIGAGKHIIDLGPQAVPLIVSSSIIIKSLIISILIGFIGGLIPSLGFLKLKPIDTIRKVG